MDSSQTESLSRTTVDVAYHCGQLAKNLLALECCRMKAVSRRTRLETVTQLLYCNHAENENALYNKLIIIIITITTVTIENYS